MRRHLNTLYVTSQGAYLSKDGANIVVSVDREERGRVPIHQLGSVIGFGRVALSPTAMGFCAEEGVSIAFFSEAGRFLARVEGPVSGNVLLRREQYRRADEPAARGALVASIVTGKILGQRAVVRRVLRDHGKSADQHTRDALQKAEARLTNCARRTRLPLSDINDVDTLRGIEGEASAVYFGEFNAMVRNPEPTFRFSGRSRRPPLDALNAMLSFAYALLAQDCRSALEGVGLDPNVGFLHVDRPGRPSLALDLMEEFRSGFADRLVLSMINRRQVKARGFKTLDGGAVHMNEDTRKALLVAYQERKRQELTHPYLDERTSMGLAWHLQARLLARHLRGDLDAYPAFVWR